MYTAAEDYWTCTDYTRHTKLLLTDERTPSKSTAEFLKTENVSTREARIYSQSAEILVYSNSFILLKYSQKKILHKLRYLWQRESKNFIIYSSPATIYSENFAKTVPVIAFAPFSVQWIIKSQRLSVNLKRMTGSCSSHPRQSASFDIITPPLAFRWFLPSLVFGSDVHKANDESRQPLMKTESSSLMFQSRSRVLQTGMESKMY